MTVLDSNQPQIDIKRIPSGLNRRDFLKRMGGGITIALTTGSLGTVQSFANSEANDGPDFNAYLRVKDDGRIDCMVGKIEMGQSVFTSLKQLMAEELDVSLDDIDIFMGDTDLCPYDAGTWGSLSIRSFGRDFRMAAAEARATLLVLASKELETSIDKLKVDDGIVYVQDKPESKIPYAALAKGKQVVKSIEGDVKLKSPSEFKVMGKSVLRHDALEKVNGEAKFAADMRLPGMRYASILRPTDHRAKLKKADTTAATKIAGVEIVNQDGIIAALHEDPEIAYEAMGKIDARWEIPDSEIDNETIFEHLLETGKKEKVVEEAGSSEISSEYDFMLEETYQDGYKAHAPLEPHAATAMMEGDKLVVWASSQTPFGSRRDIAKALDIPEEKVQMKQVFLGGGFGGKIYNPQAIEVAKLTKITGKPIQLNYTRKEEFFYDYFRPAAVVKAKSVVSREGNIRNWNYDVYYAGARGSQFFYQCENKKVRSLSDAKDSDMGHLFSTGAWRAPGNSTNTFARESQLDTLASMIGMDPLDFRIKNLKEDKLKRTLKLAADKFGWDLINKPSGVGWGIACGYDAGTWVALITEVEVDKSTGFVQVNRCVCVQDMGLVVNPHGAKIQVEGGITMGLGYALTEDIEFKGGDIVSKNFDDYHITTFSMTPKIETFFVDDPNAAPQGGGEPAIIAVGGSVANAIYDACGARVTRLPMTPTGVLAALGKV